MQSGLSGIQICEGFTGHSRFAPRSNTFRYPVLYIRFNSRLAASANSVLRKTLKVFSFSGEDYLHKRTGDLAEEIRAFLQNEAGYEAQDIELVTIPRMFGYAFNPVSFWLCRKGKALDAVLCEVNNTFGERHFYWIRVDSENHWIEAAKRFHVSPFLPMVGYYKFRFQDDGLRTRVDINYHSPSGQRVLSTWIDLSNRPIEEASVPRLLFKYGWFTVFVVARIHFQALKLYFKRVQFFKKPALHITEVSR